MQYLPVGAVKIMKIFTTCNVKDAHVYHQLKYLLPIFYCSYKALIIGLLFISFYTDFMIVSK